MNRLQIKQWGNSKAIRLPKEMLSTLGADLGDFIELQQMNDYEFKLIVLPKKRESTKRERATLQELLATTDHDFELESGWENVQSVGKEAL